MPASIAAQFSLVVTVLGDTFLGVAFHNLLDYVSFCYLFMEVIMFTGAQKSHLLAGLDLLAAQKARFAKSQPEFATIADGLASEYDAIRIILRSSSNEASTPQKK